MEKIKIISLLLLYIIAITLAIYFILYGIKEVKINKEKSGYILIIMNTIILLITIIGAIAYCSIITKLL